MKRTFYLSLLLNIAFILFFAGKRLYYSRENIKVVPQTERWVDMWNRTRMDVLKYLPIDSGDIVFVGNSLTEYFPLNELYHSFKIKNRGISGNEMQHVMQRIRSIAEAHPGKIFLEIGINDFNSGYSVDSTFTHYITIINIARETSPRTQIYIQSLLPTCMEYSDRLPKIIDMNSRLKDYSNKLKLSYIDLYMPMLHGDKMDSSFTEDGLHLNSKGYAIWKHQIDKYVEN